MFNTNGDPTDDDINVSGTPDHLEATVALSIDEFNANNFAICPSLATSILNNALRGNATVEVIDSLGKTMISTSISQILQFIVKRLKSGLYFV